MRLASTSLTLSALPGKPESACRKGIAPAQYVGACPYRQTASHPGSGPGQTFGGNALENCLARFTSADTQGLFHREDEDFSIADLSGLSGCPDGFDNIVDH